MLTPPTTRTRPSARSVAECCPRGVASVATTVKPPPPGFWLVEGAVVVPESEAPPPEDPLPPKPQPSGRETSASVPRIANRMVLASSSNGFPGSDQEQRACPLRPGVERLTSGACDPLEIRCDDDRPPNFRIL